MAASAEREANGPSAPGGAPGSDRSRLEAVRRHGGQDPPSGELKETLDRVAGLAAQLAGTPVGLVTLVDQDRQWHVGVEGTKLQFMKRQHSLCARAIETEGPEVVEDLREDSRFEENPYVPDNGKRRPEKLGGETDGEDLQFCFYAGAPLVTPGGQSLGTVCALGKQPRELETWKVRELERLAGVAREALAAGASNANHAGRAMRDPGLRPEATPNETDVELKEGGAAKSASNREKTKKEGGAKHAARTGVLSDVFALDAAGLDRVRSTSPRRTSKSGEESSWADLPESDPPGSGPGQETGSLQKEPGRPSPQRKTLTLRREKLLLRQERRLAGAWEVDLRNGTVLLTKKARDIHGLKADLRAEDLFRRCYPPESRRRLLKALMRCVSRGEPFETEMEMFSLSGDQHWIRVVGAPTETANGEVSRITGGLTDITSQKTQSRKLERQSDLFEKAQEIADVGAWEYDAEAGEAVWTDKAYRIVGLPPTSDNHPENTFRVYHEEDRPEVKEAFTEALENGSPFDLEVRLTEKEAGEHRWVRARGEPRVEDGNVTGVRGTIQDITQRKRRQEALRSSRNRYRTLIENFPEGAVLLYDHDLTYRLAGGEGLEAVGLDVDEVVGSSLFDLFPEEVTEVQVEYYRRALEGERCSFTQSFQGRHYRVRTLPVRDSSGTVVSGMVVTYDVTERREQRERLERRRDRIEAVYSTADRLLKASSQKEIGETLIELVKETLGYPGVSVRYVRDGRLVPEHVAESTYEFMPERPDFQIEGESAVAEVFRTGQTLTVDDVREISVDDPNDYGDLRSTVVIPMGSHGTFSVASPEPGDITSFDTHLLEVLATYATSVLDGLERREALREERDLLDRLLSTSPAAVVLLDSEGKFIRANGRAKKVLGIDRDELTERAFNDPEWGIETTGGKPIPDEDLPFSKVIRTGEPVRDYEHAIRWPDGTRRILSVSGAPLRDAEGALQGALFHLTDITEQKRRERQLIEAREEAEQARREAEEAARLKSSMLANMSHEIRTPLTSIIGFAEAIGEEVGQINRTASEEEVSSGRATPPGESTFGGGDIENHEEPHEDQASAPTDSGQVSRFANLIERSGNRLLETLDGVLNLSKLEAGQMEFDEGPVDLCQQAQHLAEEFRREAEEKGLVLQAETPDVAVRAACDESGLQIALQNLISNAIKYTKQGGHIWVRVRQEETRAIVEVEDTGIGIEPDRVEQLFEPFRQASDGRGREYEGTGIGLAVVEEAVEQMGGELRLETEKEEGSRFTLRLPKESSE